MFVLLTLLACSTDPHAHVVPSNPDLWAQDAELQTAIKELQPEERELFAGYMARRVLAGAFGGEGLPPTGVTVGDAIAEQRSWLAAKAQEEAAAAELAARVKAEQEALQAQMRQTLTVAVTKLQLLPSDFRRRRYSDQFEIAIAFQNNGPKDITGVRGAVVFSDIFGEVIKRVGVSVDEGIQAGGTITWQGSMDHNQFIDADARLAASIDKVKSSWEPEIVLFADGTSLRLP